jgi:hypothetical protein
MPHSLFGRRSMGQCQDGAGWRVPPLQGSRLQAQLTQEFRICVGTFFRPAGANEFTALCTPDFRPGLHCGAAPRIKMMALSHRRLDFCVLTQPLPSGALLFRAYGAGLNCRAAKQAVRNPLGRHVPAGLFSGLKDSVGGVNICRAATKSRSFGVLPRCAWSRTSG